MNTESKKLELGARFRPRFGNQQMLSLARDGTRLDANWQDLRLYNGALRLVGEDGAAQLYLRE